jgi:hypothetical protein
VREGGEWVEWFRASKARTTPEIAASGGLEVNPVVRAAVAIGMGNQGSLTDPVLHRRW